MSTASPTLIRTKWPELPESVVLDSGAVRNVTGWLKQASLEVKQANIHGIKMSRTDCIPSTLTILHFNDVYNVEDRSEKPPYGGAARFATAVKSFSHLNPLVLFSGDVFSPSILSTFTKGEQMSPILNEVGVQCAVFGNHEFDFGLEVLAERVNETNFPWLMSNVIDNETGRPLGDGKITHVINWEGKNIGLLGLVEQDWLDTLATVNPDEVTFLDFVEAGKKLGAQLKKQGCDYVIALTHMRMPNDLKLAECIGEEIDLILAGHDHIYDVVQVNGKYVIKSGTDFRDFSKITVDFENDYEVHVERISITPEYEEDVNVKILLEKYDDVMVGKMGEVLGTFMVPLEGRFGLIRTEETNLGNWVCDVLLAATGAELVLLNSGTFRSDKVHPPGNFTLGDLVNIVPMHDTTVLLSVSGKDILAALENAVSKYPNMEGRFLQVAGISFAFDPNLPVGSRVDPQFVRIGDEYLAEDQYYKLATKYYIYNGGDGYNMFKNSTILIDVEMCPDLSLAIQNHFSAIKMRQGKTKRLSKHRQSLVTLSRRHSMVKNLGDSSELDGPSPLRKTSANVSPSTPTEHHHHGHLPPSRMSRRASLDDLEHETCLLAPNANGRIIKLDPQIRRKLSLKRKLYEADSVIEELDDEEVDANGGSPSSSALNNHNCLDK